MTIINQLTVLFVVNLNVAFMSLLTASIKIFKCLCEMPADGILESVKLDIKKNI